MVRSTLATPRSESVSASVTIRTWVAAISALWTSLPTLGGQSSRLRSKPSMPLSALRRRSSQPSAVSYSRSATARLDGTQATWSPQPDLTIASAATPSALAQTLSNPVTVGNQAQSRTELGSIGHRGGLCQHIRSTTRLCVVVMQRMGRSIGPAVLLHYYTAFRLCPSNKP